ncbi:MAG TPA: DUF4240 domain-containing protein [Xanthobacteraceae bacterium]|jgi:hypothetical protein|nr:DUF4240 domain-containing protein [Xanthobacteraceae bacterium]
MDEAGFWSIVERVHAASGGNMDRKCELLKQELSKLSKSEAADFAAQFDDKMNRAYDWSVWGAAYVINGGCSDDSFQDFRASLISRGRSAYERAISAPDSLAGEQFDEESWFYEGYQYAVTDGVEATAGERPRLDIPETPAGEEWEEDDLGTRLPRLVAKHG